MTVTTDNGVGADLRTPDGEATIHQVALSFEDGVTRFISCREDQTRRRLLPSADQHPAGLPRRGLWNV